MIKVLARATVQTDLNFVQLFGLELIDLTLLCRTSRVSEAIDMPNDNGQ
jgi:hypothetical protein